MGRVSLFLCVLMGVIPAQAESLAYTELFHYRQGVVQGDQVWSGKNLLLSDVIVPQGNTLTLEPDSWLVFNDADLSSSGSKVERPELIVYGKLLKPEGTDAVKIYSLGDPVVQAYLEQHADNEMVAISPQAEPLGDIRENLHESRRYYVWLWILSYSAWLIML